jgi:hypothetical protein
MRTDNIADALRAQYDDDQFNEAVKFVNSLASKAPPEESSIDGVSDPDILIPTPQNRANAKPMDRSQPGFTDVLGRQTAQGRALMQDAATEFRDTPGVMKYLVPGSSQLKLALGALDTIAGTAATLGGSAAATLAQPFVALGILDGNQVSDPEKAARDLRAMMDVAAPEFTGFGMTGPRVASGLTARNALQVEGANAAARVEERGQAFAGQSAMAMSGIDPKTAGKALANAVDTTIAKAGEMAAPISTAANPAPQITPELQAKVKKLEEEVPNFSALSTHLNADEIALVSKDRAEEMVELFTQFPAAEEMASVAFSGKAKKGWYERSARALVRVFGADDAPRFTALLAATSPQTSVESNLTNALRIWMAWDRSGRPTDEASIMRIMGENVQGNKGEDSVLGAWINNSMTALTAADPKKIVLSGPKVNSFMLNLRGVVDEVTNDAWMANYGGVDQGMFAKRPTRVGGQEVGSGKGPGYMAFSALARRAAKVLSERTGETWTPAEIQETVWSWAKTLYEKRISKGETRTAQQIIEAGDLTDQEIGATPDFELLFVQDAYRQILEGEKYGRQLEELSGVVGGRAGADATSGVRSGATRPEGAGIDADAFRTDLRTAASRLDQLADDRARDSAFFDSEGKRKAIDLRARLVRPNAKGKASRSYGRGSRGDIPGALVFKPPAKAAREFEKAGVSSPAFLMRKADQAVAEEFVQAMSNSLVGNKFAAQVEIKDPSDLVGAKIFMTENRTAGFAIKPDGDIVSVFKPGSDEYKGVSYSMLQLAVENGGTKLDAFDTFLPDIYAAAGFKPVARIPWNDAFAPEKWDKQLFARYKSSFTQNPGEPDIVFFIYDPEYKGGPVGGFRYQSYADAAARQNSEMGAVQKKIMNRAEKKKKQVKKLRELQLK